MTSFDFADFIDCVDVYALNDTDYRRASIPMIGMDKSGCSIPPGTGIDECQRLHSTGN